MSSCSDAPLPLSLPSAKRLKPTQQYGDREPQSKLDDADNFPNISECLEGEEQEVDFGQHSNQLTQEEQEAGLAALRPRRAAVRRNNDVYAALLPPVEIMQVPLGAAQPPPTSTTMVELVSEGDGNPIITEQSYIGPLGRKSVCAFDEVDSSMQVVPPFAKSMARLYKLCDDAGAPKFLCDKFLSVLEEEMRTKSFNPLDERITKRRTFFPRVQSLLSIPSAEAVPVQLETGEEVVVYRFHFAERLQRHLISAVYSDLDNLSLPSPQYPWSSIPSLQMEDGGQTYSSSTNCGWYRDTCDMHRSKLMSGKYMLHPVSLYTDKTGADQNMKNTLEPLVCTSTILTEHARQDCNNWFVMGFLPNLELTSSAKRRSASSGKKNRSIIIRDYHRCLAVLLQPLIDLQRGMPPLRFRRGDFVARFKIICPVATILGDNLSNNKLCGRVSNHTESSVRMSRCCHTNFANCDALPHVCHPVEGQVIHSLCMDSLGCTHDVSATNNRKWMRHLSGMDEHQRTVWEKLRKARELLADSILKDVYGSHAIDNAFNQVNFGSDSDVHACTMADLMHSVEEGIFKYVIESILGKLPDSITEKVDAVVANWFTEPGSNRSGERVNYPRVSFTRGFCTPSKLSADERVGQLFIVALLLYVKEGKGVMKLRFDPLFDSKRNKKSAEDEQPGRNSNSTSGVNSNSPLAPREQDVVLDALGMGYLKTTCLPSLPEYHRNQLQSILDNNLTRSLFDSIERGMKLPGFMGLRTVPLRRQRAESHLLPRQCQETTTYINNRQRMKFPKSRGDFSLRMELEDTSLLVEQLLSFHAFLKYGGGSLGKEGAIECYRKSFHSMMCALKQGIGRPANTKGFKLQKFLECSHFLQEHLRYGPTVGHNTDTGERGLKVWAKKVAETAQKRGDSIFKGQVANNITEAEILDMLTNIPKSLSSTSGPGCPNQHTETGDFTTTTVEEGHHDERIGKQQLATHGRNFVVEVASDKTRVWPVKNWISGALSEEDVTALFPLQVVCWFDRVFRPLWEETLESEPAGTSPTVNRVVHPLKIQLITEVKLPDPDTGLCQHICRAHPSYRGDGCWFDYVELDYGTDGLFPARCAAFFEWPKRIRVPTSDTFEAVAGVKDGLCGIFQQSHWQTSAERASSSMLFSHWRLQEETYAPEDSSVQAYDGYGGAQPKVVAKFTILDPRSINRRIFAMDPTPNDGGPFHRIEATSFNVVKVEDRQLEWHNRFLKSYSSWETRWVVKR